MKKAGKVSRPKAGEKGETNEVNAYSLSCSSQAMARFTALRQPS